jgi:hypothetical protein
MKKVASMILENGGTIYGGYVRDSILRDHAARSFYKAKPMASISEYCNNDFLPEFKDRNICPNDIDVRFETIEQFVQFTDAVKKKYKRFVQITSIGATEYVHFKVSIMFYMTTRRIYGLLYDSFPMDVSDMVTIPDIALDIPHIDIDVSIVNPDEKMGIDYECNGLMMKGNTITISPELGDITRTFKIIDDIKDKIAIQNVFNYKRFKKMSMKEGWTIIGGMLEKPLTMSGDCLICHENVEKCDAQKLNCCSALYHPECMILALTTKNTGMIDRAACFHCRSLVFEFVSSDFITQQ